MAPRKDMMKVIRRDAGFSAKLGFGDDAVSDTAAPAVSASKLATTKPVAPVRAVGPAPTVWKTLRRG